MLAEHRASRFLRRSLRPQLLDQALAGSDRLLFATDAGLLVVLTTAQLVHETRLLALLLEALHRALEGLILLELYAGQRSLLHDRRFPAHGAGECS